MRTIYKNTHFSLPPRFVLSTNNVFKYVFKLDEQAIYDLETADQLDWNKLCGVTTSLVPNKNALMIGWRYNTTTKLFEVAPFINHNYTKIDPVLQENFIPLTTFGEVCTATIIIGDVVTIDISSPTQHVSYKYDKNFKNSLIKKEINLYFGGNRKAPNDIKIAIQ